MTILSVKKAHFKNRIIGQIKQNLERVQLGIVLVKNGSLSIQHSRIRYITPIIWKMEKTHVRRNETQMHHIDALNSSI